MNFDLLVIEFIRRSFVIEDDGVLYFYRSSEHAKHHNEFKKFRNELLKNIKRKELKK